MCTSRLVTSSNANWIQELNQWNVILEILETWILFMNEQYCLLSFFHAKKLSINEGKKTRVAKKFTLSIFQMQIKPRLNDVQGPWQNRTAHLKLPQSSFTLIKLRLNCFGRTHCTVNSTERPCIPAWKHQKVSYSEREHHYLDLLCCLRAWTACRHCAENEFSSLWRYLPG